MIATWQSILTSAESLGASIAQDVSVAQGSSRFLFPPTVSPASQTAVGSAAASASGWWNSLSMIGKVVVGGIAVFLLMLGSGGRR